jgi:predicted Zn-ribbon and HTH transcriptional regulator
LKQKKKEPFVPADRQETVRREIVSVIEERALSAKEISGIVRIAEKAVYDHISHIRRTLHKEGRRLTVIPAECRQCGFLFKKRERLKKPGKCPVCRAETIKDPLFSVE